MANQSLIEKLLKRQEEEVKVEVELKGLADTPFYVKLDKALYKELEKEASQTQGEKELPHSVYVERLDALVVVRSLHDHNENPVFTGELYEALGTWDATEIVKKVVTLAEELVIHQAAKECLGFIRLDKVKKENDALKN
ncbi:hypothetical protein ADM98_11445 [Exiguobacterium sp. BMC-KP]|uniref:hypothetical protein n=1 Tax=Exiguobacterium sp. BMC-KP TaxID=1684312 RepID=UPI0006AA0ADE|nr:hypothetical protein [Exiguobacterium sp. BMC-KP]KOP29482.1 hypothetical protein ADM98_11445 [Exiguobacterium sp. BMC-KP]